MTTQTESRRPAATLPETAPVAMQRGRHDNRIALARLRVERRWLVRARDKAGLAPDPQPHDGITHDCMMLNPLSETCATRAAVAQAIAALRQALHSA